MIEQYFGLKELYEVTLRAKVPMQFGKRYIEEGEPVLYFDNINMSMLREQNNPIMARGGWNNMPRVVWEDRSEVSFSMSEGVLSSVSFGILLSANVTDEAHQDGPILISKREGPQELFTDDQGRNILRIEHKPVLYPTKKTFIFEFDKNAIQSKVYGTVVGTDELGNTLIAVYKDKNLSENADIDKEYLVDYYYKYENEALIYTIQKERFNGLFTLEGKFYSKDENEGINYTNLIYMPKVRVVSNINLRLGERADPTVAAFTIIGLPVTEVGNKKSMILEITHLNSDENADI